MNIYPIHSHMLVTFFELEEQKDSLIISSNQPKTTVAKIESDGEIYKKGDFVIFNPYKEKVKIRDNIFLVWQSDAIARIILSEEEKVSLKPKSF